MYNQFSAEKQDAESYRENEISRRSQILILLTTAIHAFFSVASVVFLANAITVVNNTSLTAEVPISLAFASFNVICDALIFICGKKKIIN